MDASPQDTGEGWTHWPIWRQLSGSSGDLGWAGVCPSLKHRGCEDLRGLSQGGDEGRRKTGLLIRELTAGHEPFGVPRPPTTAGSWTNR